MFLKFINLLVVFLLIATLGPAQSFELIEIDQDHFCAAGPITEKPKSVYASDATQDIKDYVTDIMNATKSIIQNLVVKSANTLNAFVTQKGNNKLLVYSEDHFGKLRENGGKWAVLGTLAHEIGHLHHKHELKHGKRDRKAEELEADWFMGYAIGKLGGSRDQTFSAIHDFASEKATADYPAKKDRLNAAALGWRTAKNDGKMVVNEPFSKNVNSKNTLISKLDDKLKYLMANHGYGPDEIIGNVESFSSELDQETFAVSHNLLENIISGEKVQWRLKYIGLQNWNNSTRDYKMETDNGEAVILDISTTSPVLTKGSYYTVEGWVGSMRMHGKGSVYYIVMNGWKVISGSTKSNKAKLSVKNLKSQLILANPDQLISQIEEFTASMDNETFAVNHKVLEDIASGEKVQWRLKYIGLQNWNNSTSDYKMETDNGEAVILDISTTSPVLRKGSYYTVEGWVRSMRMHGKGSVYYIVMNGWKVISGSTRSNKAKLSVKNLKSQLILANPDQLIGQIEEFTASMDNETFAVNHKVLEDIASGEKVQWRLKYIGLQNWNNSTSDYKMETDNGEAVILDISTTSPVLTKGSYYTVEGWVRSMRMHGKGSVYHIVMNGWKIL